MITPHGRRRPSDNHDPLRALLKKYIQGSEQRWEQHLKEEQKRWEEQHKINQQMFAFMQDTRRFMQQTVEFMQETRDTFNNVNVKLNVLIKIARERLN